MYRPFRFIGLVLAGWLCVGVLSAEAQYFGRNQVRYDDFNFSVLETEHFEIYFYEDEERAVRTAAPMAERWYSRHTRTFLHTFGEKKPLVFYANDADFQQTNIVRQIGQGVGGVTEAARERVIMPFTGSYGEFNHVLGHELVHSFQYDLALNVDSLQIRLQRLPLWLVEGMAEYLSIGRRDPHTAMWMRDAVRRDDLPSFDDLRNTQEYFPYRYGQAFLAYVAGKYGDQSVADLFKLSGQVGIESAFERLYGISGDSLATEWAQTTREVYLPLMEGRTPPDSVGRAVLTEGELNIAPALSPDGRYVAYLSSNIFNITLFVADAETGDIIAELDEIGTTAHLDALRFINSAGTWSPDGTRLAFVSFAEGDNEIVVWNVEDEEIEERFSVDGVEAMINVAWSPDGSRLAFSGVDGGISDLYVMDRETHEARQLTNDPYADLQPTWSPDGTQLAFTTDRGVSEFETLDVSTEMSLATIDVESGAIQVRRPFAAALHHNPQFSPDGRSLYFIANQDGFQDIYRMDVTTGRLYRVTRLKTGVSGITDLSPAMSVADQSGDMMFSVYADGEYTGVALPRAETQGTRMEEAARPLVAGAGDIAYDAQDALQVTGEAGELPAPEAGVLPPYSALGEGLVYTYLMNPRAGLPAVDQYPVHDYDPTLTLESIAPPTIGVSTGGPLGTQASGGIAFRFSDMLNNQILTAVAVARGTFRDIGGQVSYVNQRDRFNYGASAGHIPLVFSQGIVRRFEVDGTVVPVLDQVIQRIFIDQISIGGAYPYNPNRRLELNVGGVRYGFHVQTRSFLPNGQRIETPEPEQIEQIFSTPDPLYLAQGSVAYVVDYSYSGLTSPLRGGRYRFQVSPLLGSENYVTALADYRRYVYARPFTFAFQGLHIGNYGAETGDLFATEYIGFPYAQGFVRGYSIQSFSPDECSNSGRICPELDRLLGTRVAKASAELRIPVLGPAVISLIPFQYLPTELALFAEGGVAWTQEDRPRLAFSTESTDRIPVFSTGVSLRINLLGALILEPYWAYPFQRRNSNGEWGLRFVPGW